VQPGSPAARAGLLADDLIVMVGSTVVQSCQEIEDEFLLLDRLDPVQLTILREQELIPMEMIMDAWSESATNRNPPDLPRNEESRR
jgi:S1-C subfamily serine protease